MRLPDERESTAERQGGIINHVAWRMLGSGLRFPMARKKPPEIPAGAAPKVHVSMGRSAFRPGELVVASVELCHPMALCDGATDCAGGGGGSVAGHQSPASGSFSSSLRSVQGSRGGSGASGGRPVEDPIWIDGVVVELKGYERLDPTWVVTARTSGTPGLARGERPILESSPATMLSEYVLRPRASKFYSVFSILPAVLPPSYRGTAVRYTYMMVVTVRWAMEPPGGRGGFGGGPACQTLVTRTPFRVWTRPNCSGLTAEEIMAEGHYGFGGIVPTSPVEVEMHWRERRVAADSGSPSPSSATAMDHASSGEDGEVPLAESPSRKKSGISGMGAFERSLSFPAISSASSMVSIGVGEGESLTDQEGGGSVGRFSRKYPSHVRSLSRQSGLENGGSQALESIPGSPAWSDGTADTWQANAKDRDRFVSTPRSLPPSLGGGGGGADGADTVNSSAAAAAALFFDSPFSARRGGYSALDGGRGQGNGSSGPAELLRSTEEEDSETPLSPNVTVMRGRTYNIWINDEILVKFTPRKAQSTYYLGDTVSGTLDFLEGGSRRCLEVCVMLETQELINPAVLHSSRKHAGAHTVTKVQTEFHEITADLLSTHFIFTIPVDAPAAFDTPTVSVRWTLRFEFVASCLVEGEDDEEEEEEEEEEEADEEEQGLETAMEKTASARRLRMRRRRWWDGEETERGEWALPLVVHAPNPPSKSNIVSCRRVDTPPGGLSPLRGHDSDSRGMLIMDGIGMDW